jgi:hypothetical protein
LIATCCFVSAEESRLLITSTTCRAILRCPVFLCLGKREGDVGNPQTPGVLLIVEEQRKLLPLLRSLPAKEDGATEGIGIGTCNEPSVP